MFMIEIENKSLQTLQTLDLGASAYTL